jgi:hypothetical protein
MNWMHFAPVSLGTAKRHLARLGERSTSLARASVRKREKYNVFVGAAVASRAQQGNDLPRIENESRLESRRNEPNPLQLGADSSGIHRHQLYWGRCEATKSTR